MTARVEPPASELADRRPAVRLSGVCVDYGTSNALNEVDLEVWPGERVALVGPSGAGKSSLIALCNGTLQPTSGRVELLGESLQDLSSKELRDLRTRIATVHQRLDLVGSLRVVHNVNAGRLGTWSTVKALTSLLRPRGTGDVRRALALVGIEHKIYQRTDRLSGGEQQRVALARAIVQGAELILADEPVSSLDPERAREVMSLLRRLATDGRSLVVSLHAFDLARQFCDRVVGLRAGKIIFDLRADEVNELVAADIYRIDGT